MRRPVDVKTHFRFLLSVSLFPFSQAASVATLRRELVQDLSQSPDLGGRARLFGYHLSSYFFAPVSFFLPFPVFHREISSQDRPGTTIANSVAPQPPLFCRQLFTLGHGAHRFLAIAQWFVHLSTYPQPMQQHR